MKENTRMEKEAYEPVEMEIIEFVELDIITTSDGNGNPEEITF